MMPDRTDNYQLIIDLVNELSGQKNTITLPRIYLKIAGDVVAGLFLSQCVWWSDKSDCEDGWFWKANKEWKEEIGLSYAQVKRATAKLVEMGILKTKLKKVKGAPTTHYYVDMDRLINLIFDFLEIRQNGRVENQESSKSKDFQESEKSLTPLTPPSTDSTLTDNSSQEKPTNDLPLALDGHQRAVDQANGGQAIDPVMEVAIHIRWLCVGPGVPLPAGNGCKPYLKAARALLEDTNRGDWQGVCYAIDDWSENPPEEDVWRRDRTKEPHYALKHIAAHYFRLQKEPEPDLAPSPTPPPAPDPLARLWKAAQAYLA
ncbi:MAG: hypothetical protein GTO40_00380, partial [Deltaproteobacteria bacterium]|nr:hypothetical protein [Deltaproteobacteria bacterium]